ncbi:metal-dependent transcriptional regulator [Haloarcula salinisoli]|uniref:Metal-dependent transcriptional regulator n=1 Tax=Haloarcula salinisoli TaxID=2487746 RepID=A0A8J7YDP7_9EURY|nr:metal-dependent transcriptional regulator [Halomicroarcula salinisoli]MBX0286898.1 metal-dependent transcriptional regulator [Halomicroarcula salinisoli]MBX0304200.1 metal-dependent transcriptional regulator [Halomicroarcula salinisoli]
MTRAPPYLLALYIAGHREPPPVSSGRVAEMLDRSTATTTETFQRLEEDGLVVYEAYEGTTLTERGVERAAELHETYVRLSWFFRSVLDLENYETEAMRLAGNVSPNVAEKLATTLPYDDPAELAE